MRLHRGLPVILGSAGVTGLLVLGTALTGGASAAVPPPPALTAGHHGTAADTVAPAAGSAPHAGMAHLADATPGPPPPAIPPSVSGDFRTGLPFQDPEIVTSRKGVLEVDTSITSQPVNVSGKLVNGRVYAGAFMPPVMSFKPGDQVIVNLTNGMQEVTNLHTHGMFISPIGNSDNIFPTIEPGGRMQYNYMTPKNLAPGSNWYHPHMHPLVEEQVFGGASGFFYVQGLQDLLPKRLQGVTEHFMAFKDLQLDKSNTILQDNINSDAPTTRTVNGLVQPVLDVPAGSTQLWHLGNFSADIWYTIQIPGVEFTVLAVDGEAVARIDGDSTTDTLLFPPARRFDVLVQFPEAGTYTMRTLKMDTGPQGDNYPKTTMMTINVTGQDKAVAALPSGAFYSGAQDYTDNTVSRERTVVLTEKNKAGKFFINGKQFASANDITATPFLGQTEEWTFYNETFEQHPIHIHVNDMQVMSINGRAQPANGLVDTIPIPNATKVNGKVVPGKVVVRMKFRKFTGNYVFHCHILAHEDNGMMAVVMVTKRGTT